MPLQRERPAGRPVALSRSSVPVQFGWYLVVGGTSFVVDVVVFIALLAARLDPLPATVIAFCLGACVNYVLSLRLAFTAGRRSVQGSLAALLAVAVIGLLVTLVAMDWLIRLGLDPLASRILAAAIALVWNFAGRRLLVFSPLMPATIWRMSEAGLSRAGLLMPRARPGGGKRDDG